MGGVFQQERTVILGCFDAVLREASANIFQGFSVLQRDYVGTQPCSGFGRGARTARLPDVGPDVVVVAARTHEDGAWHVGSDVEAEDVVVEVFGIRNVVHLKMDMAHARARWEQIPLVLGLPALVHDSAQIEGSEAIRTVAPSQFHSLRGRSR